MEVPACVEDPCRKWPVVSRVGRTDQHVGVYVYSMWSSAGPKPAAEAAGIHHDQMVPILGASALPSFALQTPSSSTAHLFSAAVLSRFLFLHSTRLHMVKGTSATITSYIVI